ncbi:MAG: hypothetical protein R3313_00670 [Candidatus Saccharimonadales bacterium]|nr:hypothetical protein [Candidatus Saccharimonadales bacterium]
MKAVVVGASGYLGPSLIQAVKSRFKDVVGTYNLHPIDGLIQLDVTSSTAPRILEDYDVVIWAATLYDHPSSLLSGLSSKQRLVYVSSDVAGCDLALTKDNQLGRYAQLKSDEEALVSNLSNSIIIRTGPIHGINEAGVLDKRATGLQQDLHSGKTEFEFWDNVYKNFVPVDKLSGLVARLADSTQTGLVFAGKHDSQSYFDFLSKQLRSLSKKTLSTKAVPLNALDAEKMGVCLDTSYHQDPRAIDLN